MTVEELIEKLKEAPQDYEVVNVYYDEIDDIDVDDYTKEVIITS